MGMRLLDKTAIKTLNSPENIVCHEIQLSLDDILRHDVLTEYALFLIDRLIRSLLREFHDYICNYLRNTRLKRI